MQNPFRHRAQDDFGRRRDETDRPVEYGSAEPRSWQGEDQDRNRYAQRLGDDATPRDVSQDQGYDAGHQSRRDQGYDSARYERPWHQDRGYRSGSSDSRYTRSDYDDYREDHSHNPGPGWQSGEFGSDYGVSGRGRYDQRDLNRSGSSRYGQGRSDWQSGAQGQGQHQRGYASSGYDAQGYAPGADIWNDRERGQGRHDFEPDYLHWREQQLKSFDDDYSTWRSERRQKFSSDFDNWRSSRPKGVQTEAANPYVGDVSEGGTGDGEKIHDSKADKSRT
ncbi:hypothetical protein [Brevundimonas sp.]|uniref:hypothetical protein n=1 Tax=Brevundimonas sp. TaxID=1871086 RepID=UPI0035B46B8D